MRPDAAENLTGFLQWIPREGETPGEAWHRYSRDVARAFAGRVASPDDFGQDVMVEAGVTFRADYPGRYASPGQYIFGVARNLHVRHRPRPDVDLPPHLAVPANQGDPVDRSGLQRCLDQLPAADRAFILVYDSLPHGGGALLAQKLGTTLNAMRTRACRIHLRLRRCLGERRSRGSNVRGES